MVPATVREQQLQDELSAVKRRLEQYEFAAANASSASARQAHKATQSAVLDFLADSNASAEQLQRLLASFPLVLSKPARASFARQCWESLLDNITSEASMKACMAKMEVLRMHDLYCPSLVWQSQCKAESIHIQVEALESQRLVGQLLAAIFNGMTGDAQQHFRYSSKFKWQLYRKLDVADGLLVAVTLDQAQHDIFSFTVKQRVFLTAVHLARHGPLHQLESILGQASSDPSLDEGKPQLKGVAPFINVRHNGFPLLFQPLIEHHPGWLKRLQTLLQAGADASVIYGPWHCTALHMLFYKKTGRDRSRHLSDANLLQATRLLLQHGANDCLDVQDTAGSGSVHERTALIQAASGGRMEVCRVLLQEGANSDSVDSDGRSMLDYLFYLKHSDVERDQRASAGYTCMQLSGLVQEFGLQGLITDELAQDCQLCGRCRFLLAPLREMGSDDCNSEASSNDGSETDAADPLNQEHASHMLVALSTSATGQVATAAAYQSTPLEGQCKMEH